MARSNVIRAGIILVGCVIAASFLITMRPVPLMLVTVASFAATSIGAVATAFLARPGAESWRLNLIAIASLPIIFFVTYALSVRIPFPYLDGVMFFCILVVWMIGLGVLIQAFGKG